MEIPLVGGPLDGETIDLDLTDDVASSGELIVNGRYYELAADRRTARPQSPSCPKCGWSIDEVSGWETDDPAWSATPLLWECGNPDCRERFGFPEFGASC
jgi:hypothetical protein